MNFPQLYQELTNGESGLVLELIASPAWFRVRGSLTCIFNERAFRLNTLSFKIQTQIKSGHSIGSFFYMFNFDISSIDIHVAIQWYQAKQGSEIFLYIFCQTRNICWVKWKFSSDWNTLSGITERYKTHGSKIRKSSIYDGPNSWYKVDWDCFYWLQSWKNT